jgi:DNA-binding response OmpR family regulator
MLATLRPATKGLLPMTQADSVHSTPQRTAFKINPCASNTTAQATGLLRVRSLELDLTNRTACGDRSFDLRPREFRLLEYMMQRCGQLLTRTNSSKMCGSPETMILVDVHLGKLRRKVDGPNEAPMIRNVRGKGFILNATDQAAIPQGGAA